MRLPTTGPATEPIRNAPENTPRHPAAGVARTDPDHQPERRDEDIVDPPRRGPGQQQLPVGARYGAGRGGQRDDQHPGDIDLAPASRWIRKPAGGAAHSRMMANAVMTNVAALMLTPKCRASCGSTGATTP